MTNRRRLFVSILSIIVVVSALALPFGASAAKWLQLKGKMMVPRNATEPSELRVGEFGVVIYPESMPKGGPIMLHARVAPDGAFVVQFHPERDFDAPVMMDFGTCAEVVYEGPQGNETIVTQDLDGDGEVGEIWSDHFSRYSGW